MLYRGQWYDMLKTSLLSIDWVALSEYLLNIQQAPFAISNITPLCPLPLESGCSKQSSLVSALY